MKFTNLGTGMLAACLCLAFCAVDAVHSQPNLSALSTNSTPIPTDQIPKWGNFYLAETPNGLPSLVPQSGRTNLFLWARDWTGVTGNGNATPDWWFWEYFGTTVLSGTNLDSPASNGTGLAARPMARLGARNQDRRALKTQA